MSVDPLKNVLLQKTITNALRVSRAQCGLHEPHSASVSQDIPSIFAASAVLIINFLFELSRRVSAFLRLTAAYRIYTVKDLFIIQYPTLAFLPTISSAAGLLLLFHSVHDFVKKYFRNTGH